MSNNYYKITERLPAGITSPASVNESYVVFDDSTLASTNAAFVEACSYSGVISVWRMPEFPGSWDSVGLIGHRARPDILLDIRLTEQTRVEGIPGSAEALMGFRNELAMRDTATGRELAYAS